MSQGKLTIRCLIKGSNTSPRSRSSAAGMAESSGLKAELFMSIIQWGCVVEIDCGSAETTKVCRVGALILETPDNLSKGPGRNALIFNIQNVETEEKDKVYPPDLSYFDSPTGYNSILRPTAKGQQIYSLLHTIKGVGWIGPVT